MSVYVYAIKRVEVERGSSVIPKANKMVQWDHSRLTRKIEGSKKENMRNTYISLPPLSLIPFLGRTRSTTDRYVRLSYSAAQRYCQAPRRRYGHLIPTFLSLRARACACEEMGQSATSVPCWLPYASRGYGVKQRDEWQHEAERLSVYQSKVTSQPRMRYAVRPVLQ